ncbi:MAG: hypothetical protein ACLRMX_10775 [Lachnospira eligens]
MCTDSRNSGNRNGYACVAQDEVITPQSADYGYYVTIIRRMVRVV